MSRKLFLYPLLLEKICFEIILTHRISEINLSLSPISCFSIYAVCSEDIIECSRVFNPEVHAFEITFKSTLSKEIGLQFFNSVLSQSFFQLI